MSDPLNSVVVAREVLGPRTLRLRVRLESGTIGAFEPGQFVQLGLPMELAPQAESPGATRPGRVRMHKRPYSIASAPGELPVVEFYVALVESGRFTPLLWRLGPGDRLWMDPEPKGAFTFARVPEKTDLVLVATGTGLAPYVSLLRHDPTSSRWRRVIVVHGVRRPEELGYRAELETRSARDPRVRYLPVVSRPEPADTWAGLVGRVHVALEPEPLRQHEIELVPDRTHVFLCGNPDMIREVRTRLEPLGYRPDAIETPGSLHFEKYW